MTFEKVLDSLVNITNALPTIQPEIVRCKDCKYAEYIDDVKALWCTECGQGRTVAPNDFCSRAVVSTTKECKDYEKGDDK